ncbi:MAG: hypothetical protein II171_00080 [Bacteroidales bacterium]|nr:hypothetical protein [Bacteroidales bacterium]
MKKTIPIILGCFLSLFLQAQEVERVYVSTDKNAYLSGERVWCSLFCVNQEGKTAPGSAIAYMELISNEGTALEVKAGLYNGRGAASFLLPAQLPGGAYRLVAYTPTGSISQTGSRLLSIYNPFTTARVKDSVTTEGTASPEDIPLQKDETLSLQVPRVLNIGKQGTLLLESTQPVSLSLSIFHEDGLQQFPAASIVPFLSSKEKLPAGKPAREGERIKGKVFGAKEGDITILSSSGSASDIYTGTVAADGSICFETSNIYGRRELVYEVLDGTENSFIQLESPFLHPSVGIIPTLTLSNDLFSDLVSRKDHLRAQVKADTLYQFLPHREDPLFAGTDWEIYKLDDYTRFPSVQEILVEIVNVVRLVNLKGKPTLQIVISDGIHHARTFMDPVLVMMDGVVITDVNLLIGFDAMLLDRVEVFCHPFVIGRTPFYGAVNFVTQKNYVTALPFPRRVRVMDFNGVEYPVACTQSPTLREGEKDLRELLYWHPILQVEKQMRIPFTAPSYPGSFKVVAEGMDADGHPVRCVESFEVR